MGALHTHQDLSFDSLALWQPLRLALVSELDVELGWRVESKVFLTFIIIFNTCKVDCDTA